MSRPVGHGLGVVVGNAVLVVQGDVGARARVLSHGVNLTTSREHLLPTKSKVAVNSICNFLFKFCILSFWDESYVIGSGANLGPNSNF